MEKKLNDYLREGERIQWQGKPESFPLMENGCKIQILRKWILSVVFASGLLACYLHFNEAPSVKFAAVVLLVAAVVIVSPIFERKTLMKNRYWITNQRVIQMTKELAFFYMELSDIDAFRVEKDAAERPCLVLGSRVFGDVKKQLRWRSSHPMVDAETQKEANQAVGMILYGVDNAEAAEALLKSAGCAQNV